MASGNHGNTCVWVALLTALLRITALRTEDNFSSEVAFVRYFEIVPKLDNIDSILNVYHFDGQPLMNKITPPQEFPSNLSAFT